MPPEAEARSLVTWMELASESIVDPFPSLRDKRAETPVDTIEGAGTERVPSAFVALTYSDAAKVLSDHQEYSPSIVAERYGPVLGGATAVGLEGQAHRDLRTLMGRGLRSSAIDELASETLEPVVDDLIRKLAAVAQPDLVPDLAKRLPARAIGKLLGFEAARLDDLSDTVHDLFGFAQNPKAGLRAARLLRRICKGEIAAHRDRADQRDLTDTLLSATDAHGNALADDVVISILILLIGAGTKTTSDALTNSMRILLQFDLFEDIKRDPGIARAVVEESLRWQAPAQMVARAAVVDTSLSGVDIAAGSLVFAHIGSANRDDSVFSNSEHFDVDRVSSAPHLAFGWGEHRCLGLHLARAEIECAIGALARQLPDLRADTAREFPPTTGGLFRTVTSIPVHF